MKKLIRIFSVMIGIAFLILVSYGKLYTRQVTFHPKEMKQFLSEYTISESINESIDELNQESDQRSVWISYIEWNAFRNSCENPTKEEFENFFKNILDHCKRCHINNVIVQVRPFADSLYQSNYFPWAACISGTQGSDPGFDPLEIMVTMAHKRNMTIEAWVNPYRISSKKQWSEVSEQHIAKQWLNNENTSRNVLLYDGSYYFNPAKEDVRQYIIAGIQEIVRNYKVDGIHMDDYFYPTFTKENVSNSFDSMEYHQAVNNGEIDSKYPIAQWRRDNVSSLVKSIYNTVKSENSKVRFGISPQGNINNLKSDYSNYVDIDRWLLEDGYIDYIMPQIYWGYQEPKVPFDKTVNEWKSLIINSSVELMVGLQLYKYGEIDQSKVDYEELQNADLLKKQIQYLEENEIHSYCFFSYQYLDSRNKTYHFNSTELSERRKEILDEVVNVLEK